MSREHVSTEFNCRRISVIVHRSVRDWSKSIGGGGDGPEHLEMWLIKNT